jgi:bacteriocin-like protein
MAQNPPADPTKKGELTEEELAQVAGGGTPTAGQPTQPTKTSTPDEGPEEQITFVYGKL